MCLFFLRNEELGVKTAQVTNFGDFLKYWEILVFFSVALYSRLMVHSREVFWYLGRLAMKISEGGRRRGILLKEWTTHSLSRGLVVKLI